MTYEEYEQHDCTLSPDKGCFVCDEWFSGVIKHKFRPRYDLMSRDDLNRVSNHQYKGRKKYEAEDEEGQKNAKLIIKQMSDISMGFYATHPKEKPKWI